MFSAIYIEKGEAGQSVAVTSLDEAQLPDGDVSVDVEYSTLNYKDGLAITGKSPVVRKFPMVPGIDLAGVVTESSHADWKKGDRVVLNGWGVGETHWGGLAQRARLNGDWLVPLPDNFTARQAMAIGTAGYTASLCVDALLNHGVSPDQGEVLVTGATGGVGSVAIALLVEGRLQGGRRDRKGLGGRLSQGPRRHDGAGSRRVRRGRQADAEGALGGRHRLRRQPHAGERLRADALRRRGRRVRPGPGHGLSGLGRTVHPPRCLPARHRERDGAQANRGWPPGLACRVTWMRARSMRSRRRSPWARRSTRRGELMEGNVRGRIVVDVNR